MEIEKGTNSSLAVLQPFGGYRAVLEGDWGGSCLVSALKLNCPMAAAYMCKLEVSFRHRDF